MEPPERPISLDGEVLRCPTCGGDALRHGRVVVATRRADNDDGTVTVVSGSSAHSRAAKSAELPGRRDSLVISFRCENEACPPLAMLVQQHKGSTLVRWVSASLEEAQAPQAERRPATVHRLPKRGER